VIGNDWTGSCKANYCMITTTTAPSKFVRKDMDVNKHSRIFKVEAVT
jgi:hypothetical protein